MHVLPTAGADDGPHAAAIALAGLVALAVAMGIGRFAFTPIMPMMEADAGLTPRAADWLAAVNYLGYLVGALCAARLSPAQGVRGGLLLIAVATFTMGLTHDLALQLLLRLAAGVASAWVLIHVSAWTLTRLLDLGRADANGTVYAGVGIGIAAAGLIVLGTMHVEWNSDRTWQLFGVLSLVATIALWRAFRGRTPATHVARAPAPRIHWTADKWRLMWCYGALGIGYIIPATYLPAMAHRYVANPLVFGLAWPVFGTASALSTWIAARWLGQVNDRRLWAGCFVLMAIGCALPALWPGLPAILIAALLVGGTFMVVTMQGLREARRAAGAEAEATAFIAVMTAAFAIGQILGPLAVRAVARVPHGFVATLLGAAVVVLAAAWSLWRSAGAARAAQT